MSKTFTRSDLFDLCKLGAHQQPSLLISRVHTRKNLPTQLNELQIMSSIFQHDKEKSILWICKLFCKNKNIPDLMFLK